MMINFIVLTEIGSDAHMTSTLGVRGGGGKAKMRCYWM